MTLFEVILLAIAMSIDALLVSFSYGLIMNSKRMKNAIILSSSFGFFQFIMPIIGWYLSSIVYDYLQLFSKWIVFAIFFALAMKFFVEALKSDETGNKIECLSLLCILTLAIATSIDALGAGISLRFIDVNVFFVSTCIGVVTFVNSFIGFMITGLLNKIPSKYIGISGSVLLFYLAIKSIL